MVSILIGGFKQKLDSLEKYDKTSKKYKLYGRIYINKIKIINDEIGEFDRVFSIYYKDTIFNEEKAIEDVSFPELIAKLDSEKIMKGDSKSIKHTLNALIIDGLNTHMPPDNRKLIETETKVFKEGFFIKDGKVVENTKITGLKRDDNKIRGAIRTVNDVLKDRGEAIPNDCTLLRFMLWSPFSWCLKKIGKSAGIYAMILAGAPKTSKTGSCLNFSWLYSEPSKRLKSVNTTSVFGSVLEESTLPNVIDESFDLISKEDMQDPMKCCIYEETSRSVKNRKDNILIDEFKALSLPIFT